MAVSQKEIIISSITGNVSKENIFRKYNVPHKLQFAINIIKKDADITYICPECGAVLQGKWEIEEGITTDLEYNDISKTYDLRDRENGISWHHREITDNDYKQLINIVKTEYKIPEESKAVWREIEQVRAMKKCPVCSALLVKKFPFVVDGAYYRLPSNLQKSNDWHDDYCKSLPKHYYGSVSDLLAEIEKGILDKTSDDAKAYIQQNDIFVPIKSFNGTKSADFLKSYLLNLVNLETNIVSLSKRLELLYLLRAHNDRDVIFEDGLSLYALTSNIAYLERKRMLTKQGMEEWISKTCDHIERPEKPIEPVLQKANFFNKKKVEALNKKLLEEFEQDMACYAKDVEDYKEEVRQAKEERELAIEDCREQISKIAIKLEEAQKELKTKRAHASILPTKARGKKYMLDTEIASVEKALKDTFACRNELYSFNIIFDKYRNLVALSTFYEYFMAGRCETLEGMNGAYNLYENEVRLNAIITKLDEIKENQYLIYNKLRSIEDSLSSLNRSFEKVVSSLESIDTKATSLNKYLEKISANTAVIAHNSAVTAYYSRVNAELTNALGFMVALK